MSVADAVNHLGDLDYATRTRAAASLRRRPAASVAPALLEALERHTDGYVRFRVLVLLSAFNHPRIPDVMCQATYDPNDRLRDVAYSYFEQHPDPAMLGPSSRLWIERPRSSYGRRSCAPSRLSAPSLARARRCCAR